MDLVKLFRPFLNLQVKWKRRHMQPIVAAYEKTIPQKNSTQIQHVTGTFIYNRPPDYQGAPAVKWSVEDWVTEFNRLKLLGIDTVIYQGVIAELTTGEIYCYYPISESSLQKLNSIWKRCGKSPIIEPSLDAVIKAAEITHMQLHLGLYNVLKEWYGMPKQPFIDRLCQEELVVAQDLITLYGKSPALKGWYISPEIMFVSHGYLCKLDMNRFLKPICQVLKRATPNLSIGISPGSVYNKKLRSKIIDFWIHTIQDTGVNIIYPQDSVGVLMVSPEKTLLSWELWKEIGEKAKVEVWANCESFERITYIMPNPLISASFPRFLMQLEAVSPYVKKVITWEAMYFLNPAGASNSKKLLQDYQSFFQKGF